MRKLVLLLGVAVLLLTATPAGAVGVNDVDMNVVAERGEDGRRHVHVAGVPRDIQVVLRSFADEPRIVTLSVRGGTLDADVGPVGLGGEGAAAWVGFSPLEVVLAPGERMAIPVTVDPSAVPDPSGTVLAFVLAAPQGEVVTQAASIVRITAVPPPPPWALWLVALTLLLVVASGVARQLGKRRTRFQGAPAPA